MKLNILIGGKAGQGINKISSIVAEILTNYGYFTFNYRDYPSLIRGGHNFNILTISDTRVGSSESKLDGIVALDEKTSDLHKEELKKDNFILQATGFENLGKNLNLALAGALLKILGIEEELLLTKIEKEFSDPTTIQAAKKGYASQKVKYSLKKLTNTIRIMNGNQGIAQGAVSSGIQLYLAYPMTPATNLMQELAEKELEKKLLVFQAENEIAVANAALGASFAGARVMIGTSGGGFDLMSEALSLEGQNQVPLVAYLASRPGPGTGVPTHTMQGDLEVALRAGHGEFPRIVMAPGDSIEAAEKTNEAFYLAAKFNTLAIILSDKHLAESEFSLTHKPNPTIPIVPNRSFPGDEIVKVSSYEHDEAGNTTEDPEIIRKNAENRVQKYQEIKKACEKFEMFKVYGKENSKNLILGWGSTKGAILDAIEGEDFKFLQVLYMKPMSNLIKQEIEKAQKVILIENNLTGQLGRLIREKTGIKIEKRILKYDGRPFKSDELRELIKKQ